MATRSPTTVADIMNPKLLYILEGDRLELARAQIVKFGVTAVPVLDEEHRPVGIVSLRDFAKADHVVASSPVITIRSTSTIVETAHVLAEHALHHVVVVDDDGRAVGMVSSLDVLNAFTGAPPRHPARFSAY